MTSKSATLIDIDSKFNDQITIPGSDMVYLFSPLSEPVSFSFALSNHLFRIFLRLFIWFPV